MAQRGDDWGRSPDPTERLPWLEPAEEYEEGVTVSRGKLVGVLAAAILLVLAIWGVVHWAGNRSAGFDKGDGSVIAAPSGPYKVTPADKGGMAVAGEGDTVYQTGAGVDNDGRIDLSALPETPVTRGEQGVEAGDSAVATAPVPPAAKPAPAEPKVAETSPKSPASAPASAPAPAKPKPAKSLGDAVAEVAITTGKPVPKVAAAKPVVAKTAVPASGSAPAAGGNYALQLGAFSSSSKADQVWKSLSGRFAFLAGMGKSVAPLEREGSTVYRLRAAGAGGQAAAQGLCARLKVAGESCVPVAN